MLKFLWSDTEEAHGEANGNNLAVNPTGCHVIFLVSSGTSEKCSPLGILMAAEGLGSNFQIYFISNIPQLKITN